MTSRELASDIIDDWLVSHATLATGKNGAQFFKIESSNRAEAYNALIDLLKDGGFTKEMIKQRWVLDMIVNVTVAPIEAFAIKSKRRGLIGSIEKAWQTAIAFKYVGNSVGKVLAPEEIVRDEPVILPVIQPVPQYEPEEYYNENVQYKEVPDDAVEYEPEDQLPQEPTVIDREAAILLGYTEEQLKGLFGDVQYV